MLCMLELLACWLGICPSHGVLGLFIGVAFNLSSCLMLGERPLHILR